MKQHENKPLSVDEVTEINRISFYARYDCFEKQYCRRYKLISKEIRTGEENKGNCTGT